MTAKKLDIGFQRTLDTISLSDAFRRHAGYGEPQLVKEMVKEARRFAALATWYDPGEKFRHEDLKKSFTAIVTRMADLGQKLGADNIVLPVSGDPRSLFAQFFEKKILPELKLPVAVSLQKTEYKKDLTHLGKIDRRIKTAIDKGVRGVADIDSNLKYKWDRNPGR